VEGVLRGLRVISCELEQILRPVLDSAWIACGYEQSLNHNERGNWHLKGRSLGNLLSSSRREEQA